MSYMSLSEWITNCFEADPDAHIGLDYLKNAFKHQFDIDTPAGYFGEELGTGDVIARHFEKLFEGRQMSFWTYLYTGPFVRLYFDNTEDAVYARLILA